MLKNLAGHPILRWILSGGIAFTIDFTLLFTLVHFFDVYYLLAASLSFLVSATVNFCISRFFIFNATTSGVSESYVTFIVVSLVVGLGSINLFMYLLVGVVGINYLIARILIAGTIGVSSFYIHKFVSFKFKRGEKVSL